jgi:hypothetical protein
MPISESSSLRELAKHLKERAAHSQALAKDLLSYAADFILLAHRLEKDASANNRAALRRDRKAKSRRKKIRLVT